MRALLFFILGLVVFSASNAQRNCGSHDMLIQQMELDPVLRSYQSRSLKKTNQRNSFNGIITIPVVVHVIYNTPQENISDEQIYSQLQVLNDDFRRLNADADNTWPQAADSEIEFCLASRDPYGDATCGITRTYSDSTKFYSKTTMKSDATGGKTGWPADEYLNIWVCDISGLLGFATFPGGSLNIDGVVTDTRAFGTIGDLKSDFALGRTTTHEIGHWLNLRHIWGDGDCVYDDFVADTPISDAPNYNCEVNHISCGSIDMVENYMDYSDDVCKNLFTIGQKNRMRAQFEPGAFRESLLYSNGCEAPLTCNNLFIEFNFDQYPSDITWVIFQNGSVIQSSPPYPNTLANSNVRHEYCLPDGEYTFQIVDAYGDGLCCNEGSGNYQVYSTYKTIKNSNGMIGTGESFFFTLNDSKYRFVGPGKNWMNPNNWNKYDPPSECYEGEIIIESECEYQGMFEVENDIRIRDGGQLTIK